MSDSESQKHDMKNVNWTAEKQPRKDSNVDALSGCRLSNHKKTAFRAASSGENACLFFPINHATVQLQKNSRCILKPLKVYDLHFWLRRDDGVVFKNPTSTRFKDANGFHNNVRIESPEAERDCRKWLAHSTHFDGFIDCLPIFVCEGTTQKSFTYDCN